MSDFKWNSWGASVIGPLHTKTGTPNQDFWMARRYKWGNVIGVSDGLGSKLHSEIGSKAACLAVFEAAKSYQAYQQANIADILRLIHATWLVRIAPFSPSDCSATCLFVIQSGGIITLGCLGDGMIAVYGESEEESFILSDNKEESFSNLTDSLYGEFKLHQWKTARIASSKCKAVVLCTDGISDDLIPEMRLVFSQEISTNYARMAPKVRGQDIRRWLNDWPVPGHTDDKTIACLFKRGDPKWPKDSNNI